MTPGLADKELLPLGTINAIWNEVWEKCQRMGISSFMPRTNTDLTSMDSRLSDAYPHQEFPARLFFAYS